MRCKLWNTMISIIYDNASIEQWVPIKPTLFVWKSYLILKKKPQKETIITVKNEAIKLTSSCDRRAGGNVLLK